jgi:hypothetical protein
MLRMMGWETANIHLGSRRDLGARLDDIERQAGESWLVTAAEDMVACTRDDHAQWQKYQPKN